MKIKYIITDILGFEPESWEIQNLRDLDGWDSVCRVRLIVEVEKELGFDLTLGQIENIEDIKFLIEVLNVK
jgi:acyl carrier protein